MTRTAPCPQRGCCRAKRGTSPGKGLKNLKNKFQKRHTPPPLCRRGAKRPVCRHSVPVPPKNAPPRPLRRRRGTFFFGRLGSWPKLSRAKQNAAMPHRSRIDVTRDQKDCITHLKRRSKVRALLLGYCLGLILQHFSRKGQGRSALFLSQA